MLKYITAITASVLIAGTTFAGSPDEMPPPQTEIQQPQPKLFQHNYWYLGVDFGASVVHDSHPAGTTIHSVGPGWDFHLGYQITDMFGAEAGYLYYNSSRQKTGSTTTAITDHYSAYLAGTAQYPVYGNLALMGKLGLAYSYAQKIATGGALSTGTAVNVFTGAGAMYPLTHRITLVGQWTRAWGNTKTGSTDLYSIGINVAIV